MSTALPAVLLCSCVAAVALLGCSVPAQVSRTPGPPSETAQPAAPTVPPLLPHSPGPLGDREGIDGKAVPLDAMDPRYKEYFEVLRRQIQEKWIYPREAADKLQGGSLLVEFGIRRDGNLQFIEVQRSSGVTALDESALNALKFASPFPPVPEPLLQGAGLPISVRFNYVIETLINLPKR